MEPLPNMHVRARLFGLLLGATLSFPAMAGPWDDAMDAYARGQFGAVIAGITPLAEAGDIAAQNRLAHMYYFGEGGPIDYAAALGWSQKAAAQGDGGAMSDIGAHYADGNGVPQDYAIAKQWYQRSADLGDTYGIRNLGIAYATGRGVAKDEAKAIELYKRAAEMSDGGAQYLLGLAYESGILGVKRDNDAAMTLFRSAAEANIGPAQRRLAITYAMSQRDGVMMVMWDELAIDNDCLMPLPALIAGPLTSAEISAGLSLAKGWAARHPREFDHPHPSSPDEECALPYDPADGLPETGPGV